MLAAAFFLSGAAALIYQVTWQRLLALDSGVGIYSIAMIVAAFMVGLGLGSHLGGLLSARLPPRSALLAFAGLELAIGLFGLASARLYYDWLYVKAGGLYTTAGRAAILHFLSLALPTVLMGMSLPLLVRATVRDTTHAARAIGLLYGVNVLGACAGALVTPWVLVRFYGIREALLVAGAANLLAAGIGLVAGLVAAPPAVSPGSTPAGATGGAPEPERRALTLAAWAALFALSGFCALSLEIVWFRIIDVAVKSTAFTFGTVLAVYLFGLAVGTFIGITVVGRRGRRGRLLAAFLACECAMLAVAALAVLALTLMPPATPFFAWFFELWGGRRSYNLGGAWSWPPVWRLYLLLPLALYGLPTVLMGVAFTVLHRAVHGDVAGTARRVGVLQAANIAGCVGGSLLAGLLGLTWAGSAGVLRLVVLVGLAFAAVGITRTGARAAFAAVGAGLAVLALLMPDERALWLRLHGLTGGDALVAEDASGVVALTPREDGGWRVWVNGRTHSTLPFGGIHTALGAVPALIHPAPREVAVIGLGSGDTAWAAGCRRGETRRVRVYEICARQLALLTALAATPDPPPKLNHFLRDPRLEVRVADGRHALSVGEDRYDLIEMDPLPPSSPYSGNLYSLEFFSLCARRLNPGGVLCTWGPTERVRRTFLRALPHVLELADGRILVGSNRPVELDLPAWEERARSEAVRSYLGEERAREMLAVLRTVRPGQARAGPDEDVNRDLVPRDEFNRP